MSSDKVSKVEIILEDQTYNIEVPYKGSSISQVAEDNGIEVPYSCQGGVCRTCRALIKEGEVSMDENYALTDEEVEQGFVLTCQAHPISDKVVIDFDDL
jgi:ring-1,2-phenylacetyl-CoA epoxidase subunit PaaE